MSSFQPRRVLALNVRSQSFAFAVFEGPDQLLDWGAKTFRSGVNAVGIPAGKKLAAILAEYRPDTIVLTIAPRARASNSVVRAVKKALDRSRGIKVRAIDPRGAPLLRMFPCGTQQVRCRRNHCRAFSRDRLEAAA